MCESQELSSFVEDGTTVVNVRASDVRRFLATFEVCESRGYGSDHGLFKLKVHDEDRKGGTSLKALLRVLKKGIQEKCVLQQFRRYPSCRDVFGYKTILPTDESTTKQFVQRMLSHESYFNCETCCLKILKQPERGISHVIEHYYEEIQSHSVMISSGRSQPVSGIIDDFERLLEEGVILKADYERIMEMKTPSWRKDNKPKFSQCTCEDCFTESESEDDAFGLDDDQNTLPCSHEKTRELPIGLETYPKYSAGIQLKNNTVKVVKGFGLSDIFSLLNMLPHSYTGLQLPFFYVGEEHSTFVAHGEDAALLAASYLHEGCPKTWISVAPPYYGKVAEALRKERMELAHTSCHNSLSHKYYMPFLSFLKRHNIPFHTTVQYRGEFVILYPNTVHFGFNMGPNIAEAINFGTKSWIMEGVKAGEWRCRCFGDSLIHLDMKPLVAAFYPDKFRELFGVTMVGKGLEGMTGEITDPANNHSEVLELHDSIEGSVEEKEDSSNSRPSRKVKIFVCPDQSCSATFKEHRGRLERHVNSRHKDNAEAYLQKINQDYPKRVGVSSPGIICKVCNTVIHGSVTHLEKHMQGQIRNGKLSEDHRKLYEDSIFELQRTIKRRLKSSKKKKKQTLNGLVNLVPK